MNGLSLAPNGVRVLERGSDAHRAWTRPKTIARAEPYTTKKGATRKGSGKGVACTGKVVTCGSNYGFVRCEDGPHRGKDVFFKCPEDVQGEVQLQVGDVVKFDLAQDQFKQEKLRAMLVELLESEVPNTEVVGQRWAGQVVSVGMGYAFIKFDPDEKDVFFKFPEDIGEETQEMDWTPQVGDEVEFDISVDPKKRSKLRAEAVELVSTAQETAPEEMAAGLKEERTEGTVISVGPNFGFINYGEDVKDIFFKFPEDIISGQKHWAPEKGDVVEFAVGCDQMKANKLRALEVQLVESQAVQVAPKPARGVRAAFMPPVRKTAMKATRAGGANQGGIQRPAQRLALRGGGARAPQRTVSAGNPFDAFNNSEEDEEMLTGQICTMGKVWGFIRYGAGTEIFFHEDSVPGVCGFAQLNKNDSVSFERRPDPQKPGKFKAFNVQKV